MAVLAAFEVASGFILWLILPRGGGYGWGRGAELGREATFIWPRQTWIDLHNWVGVALLVVVLVHVIVHWKWIVNMTKKYARD